MIKTECKCVVCTNPDEKKRNKLPNWFSDNEVLYLNPESQREVLLNPGKNKEWFRKSYPTQGEIVLTKKKFISDLPNNCVGRIIAVSALPKYKDKIIGGPFHGRKFNEVKMNVPYRQLSEFGLLRAKPIGTFYELFETSLGSRYWVNPSEYTFKDSRKKRRNRNRKRNEKR